MELKRACFQVIAELDEKKQEALQKTWTEVNQKFGSIFSTLLPGTSAKLEPSEGRSFLDGVFPAILYIRYFPLIYYELHSSACTLIGMELHAGNLPAWLLPAIMQESLSTSTLSHVLE